MTRCHNGYYFVSNDSDCGTNYLSPLVDAFPLAASFSLPMLLTLSRNGNDSDSALLTADPVGCSLTFDAVPLFVVSNLSGVDCTTYYMDSKE